MNTKERGARSSTAVLNDTPMTTLRTTSVERGEVLERVLDVARGDDFEGYSKHDALNARWLGALAGGSRWRRLAAIQLVMRSPIHVRPALRVRKARNPKGLSLFARAHLARYRMGGAEDDADVARALLDWLIANPSGGFEGLAWGYPYPWQDAGFFAPRHLPNRVVTSFVGQALLDGYDTLGNDRYRDAAADAVRFLLEAPRTLYEDDARRCVSYVPDESIDWIVMDVSALVGALTARLGAVQGDEKLIEESARLVRYVVSKQTDEGAWFYAEPPSASRITHDNYHTGFILDAILLYSEATGNGEFDEAYERGISFYEQRLFEPDGAPRFMSDRRYPYDIHGCAQGVITFSLRQTHRGEGAEVANRVLDWALTNMWDPKSGWFYYQKRRGFRTRIRELRWCQGWMSLALASYLESCEAAE
jgi:rhamnogalacturonyl hydrolase YesR